MSPLFLDVSAAQQVMLLLRLPLFHNQYGILRAFPNLQLPPWCGWSAIKRQVALTYADSIIIALAAQQAGCPDLIRWPKRILAHAWEGF